MPTRLKARNDPMIDIAFLLFGVSLLALIGVPAALLVPPDRQARLSLAPLFGYCIVALLAPILFKAGMPIDRQLWLDAALAAFGLGALLQRRRRRGSLFAQPRLETAGLAAAWATAAIALSLPKWIAGEAYYAYLGNIWDYFNYATVGALLVKLSPAELTLSHLSDPAEVLRNPMLFWTTALVARPSVMMVFASLSDLFLMFKVPLFELANAFMSLTLSLYVFSLYFLLRNATSAGRGARLGIPLVFVCGFWGAYLIDVNAWSQLAAVMLMPALFALGIEPVPQNMCAATAGTGDRLRLGLALSLVVGATFYLYPELTTVYAPVYCAALLAMSWASGRDLGRLIPSLVAVGLALLLALGSAQSTFGFLGKQLQLIASDQRLSADWFKYFHAFLVGGDDFSGFAHPGADPLAASTRYAEAAAGLFGLFRLLPAATQPVVRHEWTALVAAVLLVGLAWFALRALERRDLWLPTALLTGAAIVVWLAWQGNLYGAGKAFFWLSPFLLILLLLPLAHPRSRQWQRLPAYAYVFLQAISLVARLESVATNHGIPGAVPYPADVAPQRKASIEFNLSRIIDRLDDCRLVRVDLADPFVRHYVMVNLFVRDVPYFSAQRINSNYDQGTDLGAQSPPGAPDCTVELGAPRSGSAGRQALIVEPAVE